MRRLWLAEMPDPFPEEVAPQEWEEARHRADATRELLRRNPHRSTIDEILELATANGVSQATAYRLVRLFREGGTVSSLVDRKRGRRKDHRTLDKEREEIIRTTIARFYLKPTRPPFSRLVREVQANCLTAGFRAPNWRTIKDRLQGIDLRRRAKRRDENHKGHNGDAGGATRITAIGNRSDRSHQGRCFRRRRRNTRADRPPLADVGDGRL